MSAAKPLLCHQGRSARVAERLFAALHERDKAIALQDEMRSDLRWDDLIAARVFEDFD